MHLFYRASSCWLHSSLRKGSASIVNNPLVITHREGVVKWPALSDEPALSVRVAVPRGLVCRMLPITGFAFELIARRITALPTGQI